MARRLTTLKRDRVIALLAQGRTEEALDQIVNQYPYQLTPREVRIPAKAFNTSPTFTKAFVSAATVAFPTAFDDGSRTSQFFNQNSRLGHKELQAQSIARIEGWSNHGYGYHIHALVKKEIYACIPSETKHYFYLYNPDTVWYAGFEERLGDDPLPDTFGGYSADLDAIFLLMWTNRKTLIGMDQEAGTNAVFHLLLPTYLQYTIRDPFTFDQSLGPLVIKGYRYGSQHLTNFQFYNIPEDVVLEDVGNAYVPDKQRLQYRIVVLTRAAYATVALGFVGILIWTANSLIGIVVFLSACVLFPGTTLYLWSEEYSQRPVRVLGPPSVQDR